MNRDRLAALAAPGVALTVWLALGLAGLWGAVGPDSRAAVDAVIGPLVATHGILAGVWWAAGAALAGWAGLRLHGAWAVTAARMADTTRAMIGAGSAPDIIPAGAAPLRDLAAAINGLADARRQLSATMAAQIEEASNRVAHQRDQLAALMAELQQSVVVCNRDGRILLYNDRAIALSRTVSRAPGASRGAELIGLGRSIHGLVEQGPIAHALETVERRLARGEAQVSARFVTATADVHLLQVGMAPVRSRGVVTGYVLLLDDITAEQEAHGRRDRLLTELTEASRASFAAMQMALDMLDLPDLEAADRERFQAIFRDEVAGMAARLDRIAGDSAADDGPRWPLQEMQGSDLLAAAAQRIEAEAGRPVTMAPVDNDLWLAVDSFALIRALAFLGTRLAGTMTLDLAPAGGGRAHLDLSWDGAVEAEALRRCQAEPMAPGDPLTVRDVAERHGGALWLGQDRGAGRPHFRFLLPLAEAAEEAPEPAGPRERGGRPAYYDFDLFAASEGSRTLDDRRLDELACTVFDTETTGLDPTGGDEIIQIGAMRILNGRLLAGEAFDQLVDPRRSVPEAGIAIHGIRPEMLRGQPTIDAVLPAFHAFAADTVLVGHNAAFDMRFLALKEASSGLRFEQPVLDTLLLASLAQPNEERHGLDAIAARLGVAVAGRHSAIGDARTTADVFLRLIPLLRQRGITTLGEAREASRASYYARLRY